MSASSSPADTSRALVFPVYSVGEGSDTMFVAPHGSNRIVVTGPGVNYEEFVYEQQKWKAEAAPVDVLLKPARNGMAAPRVSVERITEWAQANEIALLNAEYVSAWNRRLSAQRRVRMYLDMLGDESVSPIMQMKFKGDLSLAQADVNEAQMDVEELSSKVSAQWLHSLAASAYSKTLDAYDAEVSNVARPTGREHGSR